MRLRLARRAEVVKPSPTLAITAQAKALAAQGVDVVSFAGGEPDFDTPEHIKEAARRALAEGFTKYTATSGIPELKSAIVEKFARDVGFAITPQHVLVSCGAKHSLYNFFQALLDDGDEVVVFAPYWVSYPEMVALAGGRTVVVESHPDDDYAPDPKALARALTARTRAVVLNSPGNPTGAVYTRDQLAAVAEVIRDHECLVVSDDIYDALVYDGRRFESWVAIAPDLAARAVLVNGCSKTYAMTGWRIGYAAGPAPLIAAMGRIQDQSTSNPNSIAQKAAVAALTGAQEAVATMRAEFDRRRRRLVEALNAIDGIRCPLPRGAFYAFADVRALLSRRWRGEPVGTSQRLAELLLTHARVAAIPGAPFGAEGFLRLSFVTSLDSIEKGAVRLAHFVKDLA